MARLTCRANLICDRRHPVLSNPRHGVHLTRHELTASYAIIRHNVRTYDSAGVVEVVKGLPGAESAVRRFEQMQSSEDRQIGWRYFFAEENGLRPGMDPQEATEQRQMDLDDRESKAMSDVSSESWRRHSS